MSNAFLKIDSISNATNASGKQDGFWGRKKSRRWSVSSTVRAEEMALASSAFSEVSKESLALLLGDASTATTISLDSFPGLRRAMLFRKL